MVERTNYMDTTITFGNHEWQVLDSKDDRALIIKREILELRWYHEEFVDVTWAACALRNYLNSEFYNTFSADEQARIITVKNSNPDNPWFEKSRGGSDTIDSIFLLSIDEVCKYFGDSSELLHSKGKQKWSIEDENNDKRQAKYDDNFHWWRLRSPGFYNRTSASVGVNGNVYVRGNGVYGRPRDGGGVRPALWLNLENVIRK